MRKPVLDGLTASQRYYRKNRESILAHKAEYRENNLEKRRAIARASRMKHIDKGRVKDKAYWVANRDLINERERLRRHNKGLVYQKGVKRVLDSKKRSYRRRIQLAGPLTKELIQQVYERNIKTYGTLTCYLCLHPIAFGDDNFEHKTPIHRGGQHSLDNCDVAHKLCNLRKSTKTYEEYVQPIVLELKK